MKVFFVILRGVAANVRVFAKARNSLMVQPGTNAHLKNVV